MDMHQFSDFHFIRPLWLFATIALFIALYLIKKIRVKQSGWQSILPKHLAHVLIEKSHTSKPTSLILPFLIGLTAIIAMAGPSWKKLPQPVYQLARGSVLIMDMSYSMYSTDLAPDRLTRARYKAIDLLDNLNEGEMGLIAYAGDAFIISPLTEDINNIKLLLPSLSPELMPELGSDPMRALNLAHEMLSNAGHVKGDIYWFTDGIENRETQDITEWSRAHPYTLNILGVGTKTGAPIKLPQGEFLKDSKGAIVVPKLTENLLEASAKRGRGKYIRLQNNSSDIKALVKATQQLTNKEDKQQTESSNTGDQWEEAGPYLVILLLPFVLGFFRRGRLLAIIPLFFLLQPSQSAIASVWDDLWQTKNQQAQEKFNQEQYQDAASQFKNPQWQGSAHYKAGNYEEALKAFQQSDSANALYNQGNALAKLNKLDEAINAYDKALVKNPELNSAKANKALLEQLKQQQEQQNSDQNKQDENQEGDQEQQDKNKQQNDQNQDGKQGENQQKNSEDQKQQSDQNSQSSEQNEGQQSEQEKSQDQNEKSDAEKEAEQQEKSDQEEVADAKPETSEASETVNKENQSEEEKIQAMRAAEKLAQETEQKHQQLFNKVTDDPYQLLRNKMQLEYKKRRQNRSSVGASKKW